MRKYLLTISLIAQSVCFGVFAQSNEFYFNGGADVIFRYPPRGSGGRAFVHADNNILALNFGGDFSGGTTIGGNVHVSNLGSLSVPDGQPVKGSLFQTNDYSTLTFFSRAWHTVQGTNGKAYSFLTHDNTGNSGLEMLAIYYGQDGKIVMGHNGGNVGIGTANPTEKLSINGKVRAQEIKVETANWPDYVFAKDYELPTLQETEKHIKDKGHLPGIPSAAEVKANGIAVGEMNAKLLQKIEELTLHLIEMKKENEGQSKELKEQKELIHQLMNRK